MSGEVNERRFESLRADTAAIHDFFDRVGPWFYSCFFTLIGYRSSLKHFVRLNHRRLGIRDDMKILDAGIGTGFLTINLLREVPTHLRITGLDFSSGMLIGLDRRLRELGLEGRVRLSMGDMRRMPFSDGAFDLVVTSAAMEYLPDVSEGISECGRILRPGGKLLFIATGDTFMGKMIAATWRNKILNPDHITECMKQAGLTRVDSLRFPWYFPHVNWWGMILLGERD